MQTGHVQPASVNRSVLLSRFSTLLYATKKAPLNIDGRDLGDSFVGVRSIKDNDVVGIAGLDCLPNFPGLCFSRRPFPTAMQRRQWPVRSSRASPEESLSPHLAFPTPGVAPDVDTAELYSGHYRSFPWHRLLLSVAFSFVYKFVNCFSYSHSESRQSIGVLRSCTATQKDSPVAQLDPPLVLPHLSGLVRQSTLSRPQRETRWPHSPRASRPFCPRPPPTS